MIPPARTHTAPADACRNNLFPEWNRKRHVVIGMLHAPALPGSPDFQGNMDAIIAHVRFDAEQLIAGGADGLILENFGDAPFTSGAVEPITISAMTRLANEVRRMSALPLGINVLRNDAIAALSIAAAVGAQFVRVNVLSGTRVTDQGLIHGEAYRLLRLRKMLGAEGIRILADVDVKHSAPLSRRPLTEETEELIQRAGADAVIVSGTGTGRSVNLTDLPEVLAAADGKAVLVGSGVTTAMLDRLLPFCHGLIVGSHFKPGQQISAPIDRHRVEELVRLVRAFPVA